MGSLPGNELVQVARWVMWLFAVSVFVYPIVARALPDLVAARFVAAKLLGWVLFAYVPWLFASFGLASFEQSGPLVGVVALGIVFAVMRPSADLNWRLILTAEAGFLFLFWLGLAVRMTTPDLSGLEKFMDLGLMQGAMRSAGMPPDDLWYSGHPVNYYYFGHAAAALFALLADVPADHGYQLTMATLFALTGVGTFAIVAEILRRQGQRVATLMAATAALLVLYAGNTHSFLYQQLRQLMPTTKPDFYYPDSTRFIGFDPDTEDKAFTEFIAYGFKVGDMHAHVLATPIFLLATLVLISIFRTGVLGRVTHMQAVFFGFTLGVSYITNGWDLAILGLPATLIFALFLVRCRQWSALDRLAALAVLGLAVAFVTAAPFVATFHPFVEGLKPVAGVSPAWQLAVIYGHGLPAMAALIFLTTIRGNTEPEVLFATLLAFATTFLILIPEVVYVDDIYGDDYRRANTMFKLSFRAQLWLFIVIACASGFLLRRSLIAAFVVALPALMTFSYLTHTWSPPSAIRTLDGLAFLQDERELVAEISRLPFSPGDVIVEADGASFTLESRISVAAGVPTILGWQGHERLWRNDFVGPRDRAAVVVEVYETRDQTRRCDLLREFSARYVAVGQVERAKYPTLAEDLILRLGPKLIDTDAGYVVRVDDSGCSP